MPLHCEHRTDLPDGVALYLGCLDGETVLYVNCEVVDTLTLDVRTRLLSAVFSELDYPSRGALVDNLAALRDRHSVMREQAAEMLQCRDVVERPA